VQKSDVEARLAEYEAGALEGTAPRDSLRRLALSLIREIKALEDMICAQDESLRSCAEQIEDYELTAYDEVYRAVGNDGRRPAYRNDHERKVAVRGRLLKDHQYASLRDSRRGLVRARAQAEARLNRLKAIRELVIADFKGAI
jgi:hypothetical protein